MPSKNYDAIVIGTGQAGKPLAKSLAEKGKTVALIEKDLLGGSCVNYGCTPTKTYIASARAAHVTRYGQDWGIESNSPFVDLKAIKKRKDNIVESDRDKIQKMIDKHENIELIRGDASFAEAKTIEVNGEKITGNQIFINVGTRPNIPSGFEDVPFYTSTSILEIEEIPEKLIIVGGSYIGLEFAQMFSRFGSKVTVVERNRRLLKQEDESTSQIIMEILENEGIEFELNSDCIGGKRAGENVEVQYRCNDSEKTICGSAILLATGRKSNADLLQLENAQIKHDEKFNIAVNDVLETNQKNVFALGDCNGHGGFTHTAFNDFQIVNSYLNGGHRKLSDRILNYALYTDPPMGRAGLSKDAALENGHDILYARIAMTDVARAREKGETQGFMDAVIDKKTEKIIGATTLCTGGDEIIAVFLTAMYGEISYKKLRDSVQTHPTVSELIPTMLENLEEIPADKK